MGNNRSESWIEVLSSVVAGLRSSETLSELALQAREALAELRAQAGGATADDDAWPPGEGEPDEADDDGGGADEAGRTQQDSTSDPDALAARLDALSASVEELTDLLDAGLERLETVEMQLGDPDENVDAQVAGTLERCQSRLAAIEHRLDALASTLREAAGERERLSGFGATAAGAPARPLVLVVDADAERRCRLCVALEHQGFHCSAVADAGAAADVLCAASPDVVLIDIGLDRDEAAALAATLEELTAAMLEAPPVLVVTPQGPDSLRVRAAAGELLASWPLVCSSEGEAALAAAVAAHTRERVVADVLDSSPTEETTRHAFDIEPEVPCDAASE